MRFPPLSSKFHTSNRKRLAAAIGDDSIAVIDTADVLTRAGDFDYPFRPDSNFYYLTGISEPECVLLLIPGHPNPDLREMLFISGTSEFIGRWEGDRLAPEEATKLSGVKTVHPLDDLSFFLERALVKFQVVYLNGDGSLQTHMSSPSLRRAQELQTRMPTIQLKSALPQLHKQRTIKDELEIKLIREAIAITGAGIKAVAGAIKPGLFEYSLEAELTAEFMRSGATHAFMPIVASGKNATTMHYMKNNAKLGRDSSVLLDVGAELGWYAADISRVLPASGKFTPRQREVYEAVLRVQTSAITRYKPGASIASIDDQMKEDLIAELVGLGVLTNSQATSKERISHLRRHYAHISHHLGLDVHDTGGTTLEFAPGMVVTCEPGLYLNDEGIGVRLEEDILITKTSCEVLSRAIPIKPDEIEALVQKGQS